MTHVIYGDATDIGFDAWENGRYIGGNWCELERIYHIKLKEMMTVEFRFKCFEKISGITSIH